MVLRELGLFDINWSRKTNITINGKEYSRLEDVPEEFKALLKDNFTRQWKSTWKASAFIRIDDGSMSFAAHGGPVALPEGFQRDDDGLQRRISWRWFSWYAMRGIIFAAIFSVPFDFVLYVYLNSPDKSWPAQVLAIAVLLALPSAATIYGWLAYLVNRTTLLVGAERVSVRHGPLPWWGSKNVARADIDGVMSERVINDSDSSDGTIFQPREIYRVKVRLKNGKTQNLVSGLLAADQALFIEQQIQ